MNIERIQCGSNESMDTHHGKSYQTAFKKAGILTSHLEGRVLDPFARSCKWGDITNDINPRFNTDFHLEALEFLTMMRDQQEKFRIVLMDPPFSEIQSEKYAKEVEGEVPNFYACDASHASKVFRTASECLIPGGIMVKLGYNTSKPAPHLELAHLFVCNVGGFRHDILISLWRNPNTKLDVIIHQPSKS